MGERSYPVLWRSQYKSRASDKFKGVLVNSLYLRSFFLVNLFFFISKLTTNKVKVPYVAIQSLGTLIENHYHLEVTSKLYILL